MLANRYETPPSWRDWLALAIAVMALGALVAVAKALGIEYHGTTSSLPPPYVPLPPVWEGTHP